MLPISSLLFPPSGVENSLPAARGVATAANPKNTPTIFDIAIATAGSQILSPKNSLAYTPDCCDSPKKTPEAMSQFDFSVDVTSSPQPKSPVRRCLLQRRLSPAPTPAQSLSLALKVSSPAFSQQPGIIPKTPIQRSPQSLLNDSPDLTPKKRYFAKIKKSESRFHLSLRGSFTPGIRKESEENPLQIYSIKAEVSVTSPGGTDHVEQVKRYFGETGRGIIKRTGEHTSEANGQNPRRHTALSIAIKEMLPEIKKGKKVAISTGLLATASTQTDLDEKEDKAICKGKRQFAEGLLNKNRGGGGGCVVREESTMTNKEARKELAPLLRNLKWTDITKNKKGRITHTLTQQELQKKNIVYVFERILPHPYKKNQKTRRYVGITENTLENRFSKHFSHANNPATSRLKDNEFYEDFKAFWDTFRVGYVQIDSILEKGASLRQLEILATDILKARKKPDGSGGYNLTNGGGGGSSKRK